MHMYPAHERLEKKFLNNKNYFKYEKSQHKTIKLMFFFIIIYFNFI
jgi:hypothetical protein